MAFTIVAKPALNPIRNEEQDAGLLHRRKHSGPLAPVPAEQVSWVLPAAPALRTVRYRTTLPASLSTRCALVAEMCEELERSRSNRTSRNLEKTQPEWRNGRRGGLKIPCPERDVQVRDLPPAPFESII